MVHYCGITNMILVDDLQFYLLIDNLSPWLNKDEFAIGWYYFFEQSGWTFFFLALNSCTVVFFFFFKFLIFFIWKILKLQTFILQIFLKTIYVMKDYWEEKNYFSDILKWESIRIYHINRLFIMLLVLREVRWLEGNREV